MQGLLKMLFGSCFLGWIRRRANLSALNAQGKLACRCPDLTFSYLR